MVVVDLELMQNNYFINMATVPYKLKKGGVLQIRPILLKDYYRYQWAKQVLEIDKNSIEDVEIIQMSYLEFLIKKILINEEFQNRLCWIFYLCLGIDKFNLGDNCIVIYNDKKEVTDVISSREFNDISKIILAYNDSDYDDRYVNPEVREMLMEYYKVKYKDITSPTFEKRKAFVSSKVGKTFKELNQIPLREFEMIYDACKDSEIYLGRKIIQGSYKYDVKEDIKHPLFEPKHDIYEELFQDTSVLSNKGISGAEQLNAMNIANNMNS